MLGLLLRSKLGQGNWTQVCDAELLPYLLQDKPTQRRRWPQFGFALAGLLGIVALAGPTWERLPLPAFRNAAALVIALDLSRSMDAGDIKPSRLIRARYKIADILKRRKDGQTALLVYTDDAFTVTPLTDDTETINSQLSALDTNVMPGGGSNAAVALNKAAELLKQAGLMQGQILLVTDGADLNMALDAAKQLGAYKLSILAVGTAEGAPIKSDASGFVKDAQGAIVIPKLDAGALQQLADAGGGVLQLLSDDDSDVDRLQTLFERQTQAKQNPAASNDRLLAQWLDRGPWLLLPVLPLAALAFRRGVLCIALLLLLPLPKTSYAFSWQDIWQTPDNQALQAFQRNDYPQAAQTFENPAWKAAAQYKAGQYDQALETLKNPQTTDDFYNRGNSLAKVGRFQEAIDAYDQAQKLNPDNEDAIHNKEVVKKELEKQKEQQQNNTQPPEQAQNNQHGDNRGKPAETQQTQAEQQKQAGEQAQASPAKPDDQNKPEDAQQSATVREKPLDETQQADEQWLKRIPDDPSGLLRRKFAYQYQQRARKAQEEN
jgi:Ca-activated chloride channel family protein